MNLSSDWCEALSEVGHTAVHWLKVGAPDAIDKDIMAYAKANGYTVFTQDLDFTDLLAISGDDSPSVLQIRDDNRLTKHTLAFILHALGEFTNELEQGALVTVSSRGSRARVLPLVQKAKDEDE
jgi:predicted nuclease of predicted toxin-antitoxin system